MPDTKDTTDRKPRIYIACFPHGVIREADVLGCAMAEDGDVLGEHLSSNESFSRHDMGLTSDWKHDRYKAKYPDGYELVWVGWDFKTHEGWQAALALNRAAAPAEDTAAQS